jgi:hypothetical protein
MPYHRRLRSVCFILRPFLTNEVMMPRREQVAAQRASKLLIIEVGMFRRRCSPTSWPFIRERHPGCASGQEKRRRQRRC